MPVLVVKNILHMFLMLTSTQFCSRPSVLKMTLTLLLKDQDDLKWSKYYQKWILHPIISQFWGITIVYTVKMKTAGFSRWPPAAIFDLSIAELCPGCRRSTSEIISRNTLTKLKWETHPTLHCKRVFSPGTVRWYSLRCRFAAAIL